MKSWVCRNFWNFVPGAREMATQCETDRERERVCEREGKLYFWKHFIIHCCVSLVINVITRNPKHTHAHTRTIIPPTCSIPGHASAPAPELCCPRNSPQKNRKKCVLFMKTFRVFMNHNQHELPPVPCPLSHRLRTVIRQHKPLSLLLFLQLLPGWRQHQSGLEESRALCFRMTRQVGKLKVKSHPSTMEWIMDPEKHLLPPGQDQTVIGSSSE